MADKIYMHEDWQGEGLRRFLAQYWFKNGFGALPPTSETAGSVEARINQGRWIAECPDGCGSAIAVSEREPYFICVDHGPMCNGGKWLQVIFPPNKRALEDILLKRPAKHPWWAATRNWVPGEVIGILEAENKKAGL